MNREFLKHWVGSISRQMAVVLCYVSLVLTHSCDRKDTESGGEKSLSQRSGLPVIKDAPSFEGVDQNGKRCTSDRLNGSIWIASFMFSSCQGVCPVMNSTIRDLQRLDGEKDLRFVSFTVDPEHDTPEVLRSYGKEYSADSTRWFFVHMPIDSVRRLSVQGFLLSDPVEPSAHSSRYALIDKQQRIRGYYDCLDSAKVHELREAVRALRRE